jgi:prevent-host-death family protein
MKTVSVSELKTHLSRYLRAVSRGSEVQILDRGEPVARLVRIDAAAAGSDESRRSRLIRAGILRAGSGDASRVLETRPLELRTSLLEALREEREDRL